MNKTNPRKGVFVSKGGKNMRLRPFVLGVVVGVLVASTVSVAANPQVQAYLTDNFRIVVEGRTLDVEGSGYHVLNYNNRVYTSVRLVAEALGAEVDFFDDGGVQRAHIARPTPMPTMTPSIRPTPSPTPTLTPRPTSSPTPSPSPTPSSTPDRYHRAPQAVTRSDVRVEFRTMSSDRRNAFMELDVINNSQYPVMIDAGKSYIQADGKKFYVDPIISDENWASSLNRSDEWRELQLVFEGDIKSEKKVTVHLEFTLMRSFFGSSDTTLTYSLNIDFTER